MANVTLTDGVLKVVGDIDFHTVVGLRTTGEALIQQQEGELTVDLSGVGSVNTAAMALLLFWQRTASVQGVQLQYSHVPQPLQAISQMSDLEQLLG